MKLNHSLSAALTAFLLAGGITAASAQTLTVIGTVSAFGALSAGQYTYTYMVTPSGASPGGTSFDVSLLTFNFSDPNVTFKSATNNINGTGPGALGLTNTYPGAVFVFDSGTLFAGSSEYFAFNSPDASTGNGTVGATGVAFNGSGVAAVNNISPAPAPEPSQTAALGLGVLGLAGMVFTARRRKGLAN